MTLRFLSSKKNNTSTLSEKNQTIINIKETAPSARALKMVDINGEINDIFKVLENLSCKTLFKDYQRAATSLLDDNFDYGSTLYIPKLQSDTCFLFAIPVVVANFSISCAFYFATQDISMSLLLFCVLLPLACWAEYSPLANKPKKAYINRFYTEETWKPVHDLKKQIKYFNAHFIAPEDSDLESLTLDELVDISNKENNHGMAL